LHCGWHAIRRIFKHGEAHGIGKLAEVLAFIWKFDRVNRPRIEAFRVSCGPEAPVRRLASRRDIAVLLSSYGGPGNGYGDPGNGYGGPGNGARGQNRRIPLPQ
jgi:hypothetical protein